jgi:hypothetical protein
VQKAETLLRRNQPSFAGQQQDFCEIETPYYLPFLGQFFITKYLP